MTLAPPLPITAAPFQARGPLSSAVLDRLTGGDALFPLVPLLPEIGEAFLYDDDVQVALFALYASSYGSFVAFDADLEWDPDLIAFRRLLEKPFEASLRAFVPVPPVPAPDRAAVAAQLFDLTDETPGPSLSRFVAKRMNREQAREFLVQRSIYTLMEADPHSWALPRLHGEPKAALVEIQADEYGGGRADRVHAALYARAMRGAGLDDRYGAYLDHVPAITIAATNIMSLFGLNRRLLGAIVGHLAAYEMTSSIPCRRYAEGMRRVGFGDEVADYYDEHVEADAVHEQIAGRDLAGALAESRPELLPDIMFGAAACLAVEDAACDHVRLAWMAERSSLRRPLPVEGA